MSFRLVEEIRNLSNTLASEETASIVSDSTTTAGEAEAATIELGDFRKAVDVFASVSGAAEITIDVSLDGETWREVQTLTESEAVDRFIQLDTSYRHVRAYADANVTVIEVVGKGV